MSLTSERERTVCLVCTGVASPLREPLSLGGCGGARDAGDLVEQLLKLVQRPLLVELAVLLLVRLEVLTGDAG